MSKTRVPYDDRQKYIQQGRQAKQRGIPWEISFDEWMAIWLLSGKWELRGKGTGKYVIGIVA